MVLKWREQENIGLWYHGQVDQSQETIYDLQEKVLCMLAMNSIGIWMTESKPMQGNIYKLNNLFVQKLVGKINAVIF